MFTGFTKETIDFMWNNFFHIFILSFICSFVSFYFNSSFTLRYSFNFVNDDFPILRNILKIQVKSS